MDSPASDDMRSSSVKVFLGGRYISWQEARNKRPERTYNIDFFMIFAGFNV
jgi:hypothetical protein